MAKGKCETCGKEIDSKYKYCLDCMKKYKEEQGESTSRDNEDVVKALEKIDQTLQHINWNFGVAVATIRKDKKLLKKLIEDEK